MCSSDLIVFALVARLLQPMLVNLAKAYQLPIVLAYALPVLLLTRPPLALCEGGTRGSATACARAAPAR